MNILLGGMHRSGINAIGRWLLRQSSLKDGKLKTIVGDWVEYNCPNPQSLIENYIFASQINHPEHDMQLVVRGPQSVYTVERASFKRFLEIGEEYSHYRKVIVVRDFLNWLASVCKMQNSCMVDFVDIEDYHSHVKACLNWDKYIGVEFIEYNSWCEDAKYRSEICDHLGLTFTDCGFQDVPGNGGGSSFDGQKFDGEAGKMNTGGRWKHYCGNPFFRSLVSLHYHVLEDSNKIFGNVYGKAM